MSNLYAGVKHYLKVQAVTLFDLNALINKDKINKCVFISACVGTVLFFAIHSHEMSNGVFANTAVTIVAQN